jgi:hypothetical protein
MRTSSVNINTELCIQLTIIADYRTLWRSFLTNTTSRWPQMKTGSVLLNARCKCNTRGCSVKYSLSHDLSHYGHCSSQTRPYQHVYHCTKPVWYTMKSSGCQPMNTMKPAIIRIGKQALCRLVAVGSVVPLDLGSQHVAPVTLALALADPRCQDQVSGVSGGLGLPPPVVLLRQ